MVAADVSIHQAHLVPWFVKLLVERKKAVGECFEPFHLCNDGCDLCEEFLLIKMRFWEQTGSDTVAETGQPAQEVWIVVRAGKTEEVVLLDPATLENLSELVSTRFCTSTWKGLQSIVLRAIVREQNGPKCLSNVGK